ncbi:hypothetical protein N9W79_00425 [bacterium]|nr:hypothetical protein [bacterium]
MAIHISAPTDVVIFLVGIKDEKGVLRFPTKNNFNPGVVFKADGAVPINAQIIKETEALTGLENLNLNLEIEQNFSTEVVLQNGDKATLYVGAIHKFEGGINQEWKPLPMILREMPKDKNRPAYLRAWQVLMGGLNQDVKILEADDAAKAIKDHYDAEADKNDKDLH